MYPYITFLISAIIVYCIAPIVIPLLRRLKFGQTIYKLGPQSHQSKQGTPTMAGLMFAFSTVIATLLISVIMGKWHSNQLALILVSLASMAVGFLDDYIKIVKKRNLGLIWWQKIIGQVVVSVGFSLYCYSSSEIGSSILIPFTNHFLELGIFYIPIMSIFMIFMINSTNLQDGLDGILSTVTVIGSLTFFVITVLFKSVFEFTDLFSISVFAMALCGGCFAFLRFNRYPAKVFMGDTGSMFIGGAMVGLSMVLRLPIFLLLICITPLMSSLSVIIQRIYFKITHGKRIFKMSPIHHHFELSGMNENQIVRMYAIITVIGCAIAVMAIVK